MVWLVQAERGLKNDPFESLPKGRSKTKEEAKRNQKVLPRTEELIQERKKVLRISVLST